jgi:tetratricopeptide (TPR) repeat protein
LFNIELAHALGQTKDRQRALELYETVNSVGPHVTAHHVGVARRGCGFVLAELGRLEEAAAAYRSSLEFAPGNPIALDELEYIEHLQTGGNAAPGRAVETQSPGLTECAMCGGPLGDGLVVSVMDQPRFVCDACREKRDGKWWQFWK